MNRAQRRAFSKKHGKENADLEEKMFLFGKLGNECLACQAPFDKTNKEMVMSWNVVVRNKEQEVRLYCPDCWSKAQEIIADFAKRIEERNKQAGEE